jgi:hypothetical protein
VNRKNHYHLDLEAGAELTTPQADSPDDRLIKGNRMIMERQGMRYARQKGKEAAFTRWFTAKKDLFRTHKECKPKEGKNLGTNAVWV